MTDEQVAKITEGLNEISMATGINDSQIKKITDALYDISDELSKIRGELDWSSRHVDEKLGEISDTLHRISVDTEILEDISEDIETIALSKRVSRVDVDEDKAVK